MRQRIYDTLTTLSDRTTRRGKTWSLVPGLDRLIARLWYRGWDS